MTPAGYFGALMAVTVVVYVVPYICILEMITCVLCLFGKAEKDA